MSFPHTKTRAALAASDRLLPDDVDLRHIYELADTHDLEIRRMDFKRDSLQDIFMKAMSHGRL